MSLRFKPLPTDQVRAVQRGEPDVYGNLPERHISAGSGVPCRHCLRQVAKGDTYLVLAWRPFETLQAYAEAGPLFLHAEECAPAADRLDPTGFLQSADYIVRGYDANEQIVYGTGAVTPTDKIAERAEELLGDNRIEFVHVRSAQNNCFQFRIERV